MDILNTPALNPALNQRDIPAHLQSLMREGNATRSGNNQGRIATGNASGEMRRYFPGLYGGNVSSQEVSPRQDIQKEIRSSSEHRRLYDALIDFQSLFIKQMLGAMRNNLNPQEGLLYGGNRQKIWEDMLYDEYSKQMSRTNGFDLADKMYAQMSPALPAISNTQMEQAARSYDSNSVPAGRLSTDEIKTNDYGDSPALREHGSNAGRANHRIATEEMMRADFTR
ncbi:MAG: rod-binding protein [Leptospiraceae bacterium]|nr:rod-binding protein [Leptospiraceae bacterium]MCB1315182.1 rod-binding protein [Leptospiraceae bacterium]MCB1321955.1 rod-binding protein [Leptospiraceae bacterium]